MATDSDIRKAHGKTCPESDRLRKEMGCDEAQSNPTFIIELSDGTEVPIYRCPLYYCSDQAREWIDYYNIVQTALVEQGGMNDQPYKWVKIYSLIKRLVNENE